MKTKLSLPLVLAILVAAACAPSPATDTGPTRPKSKASKAPTATPTPEEEPSPGPPASRAPKTPPPSPGPEPSPLPSPSGTPNLDNPGYEVAFKENSDGKVSIGGTLYDSNGKVMTKTSKVTFRIEGSTPFEKQVNIDSGVYTLPECPPGGRISCTAESYGYTPRTQTFKITKGRNYTLNFGNPGTPDEVYALANPPEITAIVPAPGTAGVDYQSIQLHVVLSEDFNKVGIDNLINALHIVPLNGIAASDNSTPPDVNAAESTVSKLLDFTYGINFINADASYPPFTPDIGIKVTKYFTRKAFLNMTGAYILDLAWPAPAEYLTGTTEAGGGKYQVVVVSDPALPILDPENNHLGTDEKGILGGAVPAGHLLNNVFVDPKLSPATFNKTDLNTRWSSTHVNAATFTLKPDKAPPQLGTGTIACNVVKTEVAKDPVIAQTRIELKFDEPLRAFGKDPMGIGNDSVFQLDNYTFAVGISKAYLESSAKLQGANVQDVQSNAVDFGKDGAVLGKEFRIKSNAASPVIVKLKSDDPSMVQIIIPNPNFFYELNAQAIIARVVNIHDPTGNKILGLAPTDQANKLDFQPRSPIGWTATSVSD